MGDDPRKTRRMCVHMYTHTHTQLCARCAVDLESVGEMMLMPMKDTVYVRTHVHTLTHHCVHVVQWTLKSVGEMMLMLMKDTVYVRTHVHTRSHRCVHVVQWALNLWAK